MGSIRGCPPSGCLSLLSENRTYAVTWLRKSLSGRGGVRKDQTLCPSQKLCGNPNPKKLRMMWPPWKKGCYCCNELAGGTTGAGWALNLRGVQGRAHSDPGTSQGTPKNTGHTGCEQRCPLWVSEGLCPVYPTHPGLPNSEQTPVI